VTSSPDAPGAGPRGVAVPGADVRDGVVASLALVPSVFVYGTVFGGLAVQAGLTRLEVWAMSVLVFAGASQFIAVPMIAGGASPLAVVLTTYVVNMRHYLIAATLAPAFRGVSRPRVALAAHLLNDESFAVAVARSTPPRAGVFLGSAAAIAGAFVGGVLAGTLLGGLVRDPERYGLDFAFPAVFLALSALQVRRLTHGVVSALAAVVAVAVAVGLGGTWHILVTGLGVSVAGALLLDPEAV
jgi:4-azaleucine resistance transporter AzlC